MFSPYLKRPKSTKFKRGEKNKIMQSVANNFGRRSDVFDPARNIVRNMFTPRRSAASTDSLLRSARPQHGKARVESGSGMITRTRIPSGPIKIARTAFAQTQPISYVANNAQQVTCGIGVQTCTQYMAGTSTDYANIFTGLVNTSATANKILVESITFKATFINQSASAAILTLYDVIPKRDCGTTATDGPAQAWLQGLDDEIGGTTTSYKTVGSKPWESDLFGQYYQIIKTHDVILGPGEHNEHIVSWDVNKVLHQEVVTNTSFNIQHLTYSLLSCVYGAPAHDSTTKSTVSSAAVNLDVVYEMSIRVKELVNCSAQFVRNNTLPTSFAVGQESFNPEVGQLQNSSGLNPDILTA